MKAHVSIAVLVLLTIRSAAQLAQVDSGPPSPTSKTNAPAYTIAARSPNSCVLQTVEWHTNSRTSRVYAHTNSIVALATGMHFTNNQGVLQETREEILLYPDATGASATNGPCKLLLPADIAQGVIEIIGTDGQPQQTRPLGIAFAQGTNSQFVAGITNSIGNLLRTGNQVLYSNIINSAGFRCDLLVTYRARGVECDLVIRSAPSSPPANFDPDQCSLQLLTEFFNTSPPQASNERIDSATGLSTADLAFGALRMRPGKAFSIPGSPSPSPTPQERADARRPIPVVRSWQTIDNRSFIRESAPWRLLAPELSKLTASLSPGAAPATRTAANRKNSQTRKLSNSQTALLQPGNNSPTPKLQNSQTALVRQSTNPPIHSAPLRLPCSAKLILREKGFGIG